MKETEQPTCPECGYPSSTGHAPGCSKKESGSVESKRSTKEIVAERLNQTFSSRLAEYLTGLKPEDPVMIERLIGDQAIVRAKYDLPSRDLSPSEFEQALLQIAQRLDVKIKPKSEHRKFFEENPFAGAVFEDTNHIVTDINRESLDSLIRSLNRLEHELVHAIQHKKSLSMPIELSEYEAYVAGANMEYLKANPEAIDEIFFNFFIGVSVNTNYRLESERRGVKLSPVWDNPEYFLRRDGIDPSEIKKRTRIKKDKQGL